MPTATCIRRICSNIAPSSPHASPCTQFHLFTLENQPVALCVLDVLDHGLSAMYTFFDPSLAQRSLGTWVILWQIEKARRLNLPFLYLGYWIRDCDKMRYKTDFRPLELLIGNKWLLLT